ncbi:DUF3992 domain-containing protein [Ureibacillus sinduriensis]|uniref:Endospore appendages core domain-containing protein n=1 Tax=Ureibacillus sinduriensis BLB-1 = JCM 15800 TaxID=1384057 RepID=A0A0A3HUP2_9BACL|nr:S-Ena type endospore appendage [Ureibacillus sinduriensis]KGR76276.1 hypothetical protein CD33_06940 [Ureibacillus sinduriensis BLB-1 = JCM 15800]
MAQLGGCNGEQLVGVNDAICFTVLLDDTGATPLPIWSDATTYIINGTIMVENNGVVGASPTAALTVNGTAVDGFVVAPGEARSITMNDINSIALTGTGAGTANVKVSFSLNYKF